MRGRDERLAEPDGPQDGHCSRPCRAPGSGTHREFLVSLRPDARLPCARGWELQNLLTIARLMIWSALQRQESRGVHFRGDFPQRDDAHWQRHLACPRPICSIAPCRIRPALELYLARRRLPKSPRLRKSFQARRRLPKSPRLRKSFQALPQVGGLFYR